MVTILGVAAGWARTGWLEIPHPTAAIAATNALVPFRTSVRIGTLESFDLELPEPPLASPSLRAKPHCVM
jgi:hypothetical protein